MSPSLVNAERRTVAARIRGKLIVLHTLFSLAMAAIIFVALRPALREVIGASELREATLAAKLADRMPGELELPEGVGEGLSLELKAPDELELTEGEFARLAASPGTVIEGRTEEGWPKVVLFSPSRGAFVVASVNATGPDRALNRMYILLTLSMVGVYALVALTLELLVLPRQVYDPLARLLRADAAVQRGDRSSELIDPSMMPGDELGQIMRSRNASIMKLRDQEKRLAEALARIEDAASELKRKNHLLETARRNLADQDRLVSLGMLSAGLAHEMNTPLAVLKGTAEQMRENTPPAQRSRVELMLRVVNRLEKLSESLLDFARVRPPSTERVAPRSVAEEAWTLVSLDRDARDVTFENHIEEDLHLCGDPDRLTQVFVNLLRNAVDAMEGRGRVVVEQHQQKRDGQMWVSLTVRDSGPGIAPDQFERLFEPFASSRLDAKGTGLGLAVAEGIVREHGGTLLARNWGEGCGALFEMMLPAAEDEAADRHACNAGGAILHESDTDRDNP